jgi:hypothetical protein
VEPWRERSLHADGALCVQAFLIEDGSCEELATLLALPGSYMLLTASAEGAAALQRRLAGAVQPGEKASVGARVPHLSMRGLAGPRQGPPQRSCRFQARRPLE